MLFLLKIWDEPLKGETQEIIRAWTELKSLSFMRRFVSIAKQGIYSPLLEEEKLLDVIEKRRML